jgi:anthranilate phosphoribosyltransferase
MSLSFKQILETISEGIDLSPEEADFALRQIVEGEVSNEEVAAFLFGMRAKSETVTELTAFVKVMRNAAVSVNVDVDGAVDLCGTGGDSSGTFNISTAAMFVVAGADVPVLNTGTGAYRVNAAVLMCSKSLVSLQRWIKKGWKTFLKKPVWHLCLPLTFIRP